jgi:tetratricopeptide (TPR) repeat protein
MNRHRDAIGPYRKALLFDATLPSLRKNLGAALMQNDPASTEAAGLLKAAIEQNPDDANAWINLGKVHLARFDLDSALDAERHALRLRPDNPLMLCNHALTLREAQQWDEAERFALAAHRASPGTASYLSNLGMVHLLRGNYADGWREHEARWEGSRELAGKRPVLPGPTWRGLLAKRYCCGANRGWAICCNSAATFRCLPNVCTAKAGVSPGTRSLRWANCSAARLPSMSMSSR